MTEILISFFLLLGSLFILISGIGIVRLPDTLLRAHALSKSLTLGIISVLLALGFSMQDAIIWIKVLLASLFLCVTIPIAGHVFALFAVKDEQDRNKP